MEENNYFTSYSDNKKKNELLKFGLTNEFGTNLERKKQACYNEESIIKIK